MTQRNPKLELTWIGKEQRPRLLFGDNLLALKVLEQEFAMLNRLKKDRLCSPHL